eukprot:15452216-Alexandrium_andersonii.AAC.1
MADCTASCIRSLAAQLSAARCVACSYWLSPGRARRNMLQSCDRSDSRIAMSSRSNQSRNRCRNG